MAVQQNEYFDTIHNDEDSLSKVLRILNLKDKYPGKLTREDMYQITKYSLYDEKPKCHEDLAYHFIQKIAKYNYTAREFYIERRDNQKLSIDKTGQDNTYRKQMKQRADEHIGLEVSPMDVTLAVFLCCDDICRQDLVKHMWSCRLAVPLVIQVQSLTNSPSCYLWPLRSLVMKWNAQIEGKENVRECRLVNEPMNTIAFIGVGTNGLSKSALINSVISPTEKTHSIFFHRDSPGSTRHRYLVNGLIDIGWYFPLSESGATVSTHFQEAVVFLNLHGDASKLQSHVMMLTNLASIIVILCTVQDLVSSGDIAKLCLDQGKAVLIILTNHTIHEDEETMIESFIQNHKPGENRIELLDLIDKQRADIVQETRSMLIKMSNGHTASLNDILQDLQDIYPDVDEKTEVFRGVIKEAKMLSNLLYTDRKRLYLPFQENSWIEWAKAPEENLINTTKMKNVDLPLHKRNVMVEFPSEGLKVLTQKDNRQFMCQFLNSVKKTERRRRLFLRWFHFEMDDLSRNDLGPVYDNYHKLMLELAKAGKEDADQLKGKLKQLDDELSLRSFGLEHVLREMRQMYETSKNWPEFDLPGLAAEILLDGYPFELMDGYVNKVPLEWVKTVFMRVENILCRRNDDKPVRIKTLSVLGIQSSGKSTLLNALFGCQYAESAGRGTRGVYCQFVKIEERYKQELELDYVLVIDTEGLRAPELSASGQIAEHDHVTSAFVIGLSDLTILSLMGENIMSLEQLLPISVQTFLKMNIAPELKPKFLIVHQNVHKEDKQKLFHQVRALDEMLDEMTKLACKVTQIDTKAFQDIISFDVSKDVFYLPTLHEEIPPMSPINIRYSEELDVLKQTMLVSTKNRTSRNIESFCDLLEKLWLGTHKDEFFDHKNETEGNTNDSRKLTSHEPSESKTTNKNNDEKLKTADTNQIYSIDRIMKPDRFPNIKNPKKEAERNISIINGLKLVRNVFYPPPSSDRQASAYLTKSEDENRRGAYKTEFIKDTKQPIPSSPEQRPFSETDIVQKNPADMITKQVPSPNLDDEFGFMYWYVPTN